VANNCIWHVCAWEQEDLLVLFSRQLEDVVGNRKPGNFWVFSRGRFATVRVTLHLVHILQI